MYPTNPVEVETAEDRRDRFAAMRRVNDRIAQGIRDWLIDVCPHANTHTEMVSWDQDDEPHAVTVCDECRSWLKSVVIDADF